MSALETAFFQDKEANQQNAKKITNIQTKAHIPGGGMAILSASIQVDFLMYIIGKGHFTDYFDWTTAISAGSMLAGSLAMPNAAGSHLFDDCIPIRAALRERSLEIFDPKRQRLFLFRRMALSIISLLSDYLETKKNNLNVSIDKLPMDKERITSWKRALNKSGEWKAQAVAKMVEWFEIHSHFDSGVFAQQLKEQFSTAHWNQEGLTLPSPEDVMMADLLAKVLFPSLNTEVDDNSRHYHIGGVRKEKLDLAHILQEIRNKFNFDTEVWRAILETSSLTPLFQPSCTNEGRYRTDGGSNFGPRDGHDISRLLDQSKDPYGIVILNCSPPNFNSYTTKKDLVRAGWTKNSRKSMWQQIIGNHSDQWIHMTHDPLCGFYIEFRHGLHQSPPEKYSPTLTKELQGFCQTYLSFDLDRAIKAEPKILTPLAMASTDPDIQDYFQFLGVQTCHQMLPEFVQVAKKLLLSKVGKPGLEKTEVQNLIEQIDLRFPPNELEVIKQGRYIVPRAGIGQPYFQEDRPRPARSI